MLRKMTMVQKLNPLRVSQDENALKIGKYWPSSSSSTHLDTASSLSTSFFTLHSENVPVMSNIHERLAYLYKSYDLIDSCVRREPFDAFLYGERCLTLLRILYEERLVEWVKHGGKPFEYVLDEETCNLGMGYAAASAKVAQNDREAHLCNMQCRERPSPPHSDASSAVPTGSSIESKQDSVIETKNNIPVMVFDTEVTAMIALKAEQDCILYVVLDSSDSFSYVDRPSLLNLIPFHVFDELGERNDQALMRDPRSVKGRLGFAVAEYATGKYESAFEYASSMVDLRVISGTTYKWNSLAKLVTMMACLKLARRYVIEPKDPPPSRFFSNEWDYVLLTPQMQGHFTALFQDRLGLESMHNQDYRVSIGYFSSAIRAQNKCRMFVCQPGLNTVAPLLRASFSPNLSTDISSIDRRSGILPLMTIRKPTTSTTTTTTESKEAENADMIQDTIEFTRCVVHSSFYSHRSRAYENIGEFGCALLDIEIALATDPEHAVFLSRRRTIWIKIFWHCHETFLSSSYMSADHVKKDALVQAGVNALSLYVPMEKLSILQLICLLYYPHHPLRYLHGVNPPWDHVVAPSSSAEYDTYMNNNANNTNNSGCNNQLSSAYPFSSRSVNSTLQDASYPSNSYPSASNSTPSMTRESIMTTRESVLPLHQIPHAMMTRESNMSTSTTDTFRSNMSTSTTNTVPNNSLWRDIHGATDKQKYGGVIPNGSGIPAQIGNMGVVQTPLRQWANFVQQLHSENAPLFTASHSMAATNYQRERFVLNLYPTAYAVRTRQQAIVLQAIDPEYFFRHTLHDLGLALYCACDDSDVVMASLLLKHRYASQFVNFISEDGRTPLHIAAMAGNQVMIRELLKQGANVNVLDMHGRSPLTYAAMNDHLLIIRDLLAAGANVITYDNGNERPFDHATARGFISTAEHLSHHMITVHDASRFSKNRVPSSFEGYHNLIVEEFNSLRPPSVDLEPIDSKTESKPLSTVVSLPIPDNNTEIPKPITSENTNENDLKEGKSARAGTETTVEEKKVKSVDDEKLEESKNNTKPVKKQQSTSISMVCMPSPRFVLFLSDADPVVFVIVCLCVSLYVVLVFP